MFNLQGSEIIFILLLALVVLGPEKLPSAIRRFTQTYGELRKMGTGFQTELKSALDEPMREMKETAGLIRDQADPSKFVEAADTETTVEAERRAEREFEAERAATPAPEAAASDPESDVDVASDVDAEPELRADPELDEVSVVDEWADPVEPGDEGDEGPVRESA